jgi:hypothetical protein
MTTRMCVPGAALFLAGSTCSARVLPGLLGGAALAHQHTNAPPGFLPVVGGARGGAATNDWRIEGGFAPLFIRPAPDFLCVRSRQGEALASPRVSRPLNANRAAGATTPRPGAQGEGALGGRRVPSPAFDQDRQRSE